MVKKRSAFTLVELVFVVIVLGIIASIGADIIASMYQNYLRTRTINRLQAQSEITLEQIAKRLQYRIKDSTIARNTAVGAGTPLLPLSDDNVDENFDVIEWIGYSNETFRGTGIRPLWTGLIDLEDANTSIAGPTIVSPGSNFADVATLMRALTDDNVTMDAAPHAALIFIRTRGATPAEFGWGAGVGNNSDGNNSLPVQTTPGQQDTLTIFPTAGTTLPTEISEHYYLAHTAYALAPVYENTPPQPTDLTDFNLTLYYNYQPWRDHDYPTHGTPSVLAEHVQLFRVRQDANLIRLKLCLHDNNETGTGDKIVTCKEKVVF